MYKQKKTSTLGSTETQRLHEIMFYLLVMRLLKTFEPFNLVVDFILNTGTLFGCNTTVLHRVILRILDNNILYKPSVGEAVMLLYKAKIPVRDIVGLLDISNYTVYNYIKEYNTNPMAIIPKHTESEYQELYKFMLGFNKLKGIL